MNNLFDRYAQPAQPKAVEPCRKVSKEGTYCCERHAGHELPHEQTLPSGTLVRWW